jgi:hypothetical protein
MAKAEHVRADLLERMADELQMGAAHDRGRFLAAAYPLPRAAALDERRYVTGVSDPREVSCERRHAEDAH